MREHKDDDEVAHYHSDSVWPSLLIPSIASDTTHLPDLDDLIAMKIIVAKL